MGSVQRFYAQRDNRIIAVPLTGDITNNGTINGGDPSVDYNPAIATLNVQDSKLFTIDTRWLILRTDGTPDDYLVAIVFSKISPPQFYPGFEINIIVNVKDTNADTGGGGVPLNFKVQRNPSVPIPVPTDYSDDETFITLNNVDYANTTDAETVYTYGNRTITLLSTGESWVIKSTYLNNGPSSVFM